jgi:hypothetical protein
MSTYVRKHNREAVRAGRAYALTKPFDGFYAERVARLEDFIDDLTVAYGIPLLAITIDPAIPQRPATTRGWYDRDNEVIVVTGGFSVLYTLYLFATALEDNRGGRFSGNDPVKYAHRWSQGMFAKLFPAEWEELVANGSSILTRE